MAGGQCWGGVLIGDGDEGEAGCSSCGQDGEQRQQLRDVRRDPPCLIFGEQLGRLIFDVPALPKKIRTKSSIQ